MGTVPLYHGHAKHRQRTPSLLVDFFCLLLFSPVWITVGVHWFSPTRSPGKPKVPYLGACYETEGFYTRKSINYDLEGTCEQDFNNTGTMECTLYSSVTECNIQTHIHSHHVFKNPRFSLSNEKGENYRRTFDADGSGTVYKFLPDHAIDGKLLTPESPNAIQRSRSMARPATNTPSADFLVDLDNDTLFSVVTLYPRQEECGGSCSRYDRNEHTIVFITDAAGDEVVCNPRYLYNVARMEELFVSNIHQWKPLFFDCERDVVGVGLRLSNQQFYGTIRDELQIVEIQVGYTN